MSTRPWFKMYASDFMNGCGDLTVDEIGFYTIIICLIYDKSGPIAGDAQHLGRKSGCSTRKARQLLQCLIAKGKLCLEEGGLVHCPGAKKRLENDAKDARKFAENGAKGGDKKAENLRKSLDNNQIAEKGLENPAVEKPSMPLPDTRKEEGTEECLAESVGVEPPPAPARMPRLADPPAKWMMAMPDLQWRLDATGKKVPIVECPQSERVGMITTLLIPACKDICIAAGTYDPDWRGDWRTVVDWLKAGHRVKDCIIPAIRQQVGRYGGRYRPPNKLSAFRHEVRVYAQRPREVA